MLALAANVERWPEFQLQVCFKVVGARTLQDSLKSACASLTSPVHFVSSGDFKLLKLIGWSDIVHGQNVSPDIVFPAWLMRKKLVLTIHNWRRRNLELHSILWGIGARLARRRWYNSRFVWDTWEPDKKWKGSDCVPTVSHLPDAWCPPAERKGFLFMGRWIENKGIEELVVAYSKAQLDPQQWPLILIGDGPLRPKVESLIRELKLKGVEMPGFIDDQAKAKRLAAARWLVAPANTREDLGLTPIEARSVGVPVIVTRDGGLPEAGGESALVVEPAKVDELAGALKRAASMSNEEYCQRGENGRNTLKDYLRPMEFYRRSYSEVNSG